MDRIRGVWRALALAAATQLLCVTASWAKPEVPPPITATPVDAATSTLSVGFTKVAFDLRPNQPYGVWKASILCIKYGTLKWEGAPRGFDQTVAALFASEMRSARIRVAGGNDDLFDEGSATYLVAAEVKTFDAETCSQFTQDGSGLVKGSLVADVEWQVYSTLERRIVARIQTHAGATHGLSEDTPVQLVLDAFTQNLRGLINAPEFRKLLVAAPSSTGPAAPAGDRSPITLPLTVQTPAVPDASGSVVAIFSGAGMGSGFVIGEGYLLTNSHVVGDGQTVRVKWPDGLETSGQVLRSERRRDVALVRTDTRDRSPLGLRTGSVTPGETVFAIGTPLDPQFQNTLTRGIVSAMRTIDGMLFIQSDVMVNHGNSGGPLLDDKGRVIGITALAIQSNDAATGINLFIPIKDGLDFLAVRMAAAPGAPAPAPAAAAAVPQAQAPIAVSASGQEGQVTDVAGWIRRNVDAAGWTFVGADERAAYFSDAATVASLPNGVLQGAFRSELFHAEGAGQASTASERSVWQLDCSNRQVRRIAVTAFRAHNLKDQVASSFQPNAAWEAPDDGSVAGGLAKALCPQASAARGR